MRGKEILPLEIVLGKCFNSGFNFKNYYLKESKIMNSPRIIPQQITKHFVIELK
jgi:hypothetical protein